MSEAAPVSPRPRGSRSRIVPGSRLSSRLLPVVLGLLGAATMAVVVIAVSVAFGLIPVR